MQRLLLEESLSRDSSAYAKYKVLDIPFILYPFSFSDLDNLNLIPPDKTHLVLFYCFNYLVVHVQLSKSSRTFTMAVEPCRGCGAGVSGSQPSCPSCGIDDPHRTPTPVPSPEPTPSPEPETPPPQPTPSPPMT